MPQLDIFSYSAELFWFLVIFFGLYVFILKVFVPILLRWYFSYRNVLKVLSSTSFKLFYNYGWSIFSVESLVSALNAFKFEFLMPVNIKFEFVKVNGNQIQEFFGLSEVINE
jgi:hypothetical protein